MTTEELNALRGKYREECETSLAILLNGVPHKGGHVARKTLENLVREAFWGGVVSATLTDREEDDSE